MRAHCLTPWAITVALLCAAAAAWAQSTLHGEFREFPEFRYSSGLPGGGWGVTSDGVPGFDGAVQLNVPVAYTPHRGLMVGFSSGSYDSSPKLEFGGPGSNGTAWLALGLGRPGRGVYLCEMPTANNFDNSFGEPVQNVQHQLLAETDRQPAVAIGLQDIFGNRSRYIGAPTGLHDTESPYLVATKRFGDAEHPVYVTLGWGWGRFNSTAIGGVSWRVARRLTAMAEYDGFNPNAGVAVDLSPYLPEHTTLFAGMIDLDRALVGISYVYQDLNL